MIQIRESERREISDRFPGIRIMSTKHRLYCEERTDVMYYLRGKYLSAQRRNTGQQQKRPSKNRAPYKRGH